MLLHPTEMHIQLVQVLQQGAEWRALSHLSKGIDVLGETLATVAELAVRTGDVSMGIIDINLRGEFRCGPCASRLPSARSTRGKR